MTTGRINQVTIVHAGSSRRPRPPATATTVPPGRGQRLVVHRGWDGSEERARPATSHPREGATVTIGHPIAPTEFPKEPSAAGLARSPEGRPRGCGMDPSRGGYRTVGHVEKLDGYRPRLTPGNLKQNLSQGPIIHRPHAYRGAKASRIWVTLAPEGSSVRPLPRLESSDDRST